MGQYHILVNLDKKEMVDPYGIGLGLKQWEQIGEFNGTMADALYILVMASPARGGGDLPHTEASGRWAGDRVALIGDYTENGDLPNYPNAERLYSEASDTWNDITSLVSNAFGAVFPNNKTPNNYWKSVHDDKIINMMTGAKGFPSVTSQRTDTNNHEVK